MLEILFLIIQLSFAIYILYLCLAFITGAPFVPSTDPVAKRMIELSGLRRGQTAFDLGSGDGKLVLLAAQRGANAVGLEINPYLVLYSTLRYMKHRSSGTARSKWGNFWRHDLSKADVVFVYLLPWRMEKLAAKLKQELKPGSVVVTNSFIFPGWKLFRQDPKLHVYAYKV